jgi:hypothetical protein
VFIADDPGYLDSSVAGLKEFHTPALEHQNGKSSESDPVTPRLR